MGIPLHDHWHRATYYGLTMGCDVSGERMQFSPFSQKIPSPTAFKWRGGRFTNIARHLDLTEGKASHLEGMYV